MTTASDLGIESVTYLLPGMYGLSYIGVSLPRVKFAEKPERPASVVGRQCDPCLSIVTPIGARPWLGNKRFMSVPKPKPPPPKPEPPPPPTPPPKPALLPYMTAIDKVIRLACTMFACTKAELKGPGRAQYLVLARLYVSVRLRNEFGLSTSHIGHFLNRDHSSIVNLLNRAAGVSVTKVNGVYKRRMMTGSRNFSGVCVEIS